MLRDLSGYGPAEVEDILSVALDEAKAILKSRAVEHSALVEALLKHRCLDADEVREIVNGTGIRTIGPSSNPGPDNAQTMHGER